MCGAARDVRFVPIADIATLFDDFVGSREDQRRHGNAKGFGGAEINYKVKSCWLLYRQIARVGTTQNLHNMGCRTSPQVGPAGSIASKTASDDKLPEFSHHGQSVCKCELGNRLPECNHEGFCESNHSIRLLAFNTRKRAVKLGSRLRIEWQQGKAQGLSRYLGILPFGDLRLIAGIP